ncbi:MAG TPA: ATP-binding cassette domain-containing protein, partial [Cytophagaceae bacterium]
MLKASLIHKKYNHIQILKGVDLEVKEGEIVSIVGASGAGKSTLLQILGTLDKPDQGEVHILGTKINGLSEKGLAGFRNRNIGFIFQFHNLLPEFTALENVCIPAFLAGTNRSVAEMEAKKILDTL